LLPAEQVLAMVTCAGAEVLGMQDEIGTLEAGKLADITVLDMQRVGWRPLHNPFANLVYGSGSREAVDTVVVDGELLVRNGRPTHLDADAILSEAQVRSESIVEAVGLSQKVRSPWQLESRPE
jgi:cytosine/adenosine deaminase-related metal-dependent hydrolase